MLGRTAAVCAHEAFVFNPPRLCPSSTGDLLQRTPNARTIRRTFALGTRFYEETAADQIAGLALRPGNSRVDDHSTRSSLNKRLDLEALREMPRG